MLREKYEDEIEQIISRYPVRRSALLPLLNLAQREEGYVSEAAMKEIARILRLTPPQVYEVVTFYTMLTLKPIGKFHIQVCKSLMCALVGSDNLLEWLHARLGIRPGHDLGSPLHVEHGGVPGFLRHRADDADQRRLLRAADRRESGSDSGRPQARRHLFVEKRAVHTA